MSLRVRYIFRKVCGYIGFCEMSPEGAGESRGFLFSEIIRAGFRGGELGLNRWRCGLKCGLMKNDRAVVVIENLVRVS